MQIGKYTDLSGNVQMIDTTQQRFSIETPVGTIIAVESPDTYNPGIVLMYISKEGKELASCSMQYMEEKETVTTNVWGNDPDDDPVFTHNMDVHEVDIEWPNGYRSTYMLKELEKKIQDGDIELDAEVTSAWIGDMEIACAIVEDVAECLRANFDFTY